jgi:hypothetical protein
MSYYTYNVKKQIKFYESQIKSFLSNDMEPDQLSEQILENIDAFSELKIGKIDDQEYSSGEPLYNHLKADIKIPYFYINSIYKRDITNYIRSGIADIYLKDRVANCYHLITQN